MRSFAWRVPLGLVAFVCAATAAPSAAYAQVGTDVALPGTSTPSDVFATLTISGRAPLTQGWSGWAGGRAASPSAWTLWASRPACTPSPSR